MILQLAGAGPDLIQVTAQYSNAVLVALLPYFSDAAHKLDLPLPQPITAQQVVGCGVDPFRYPNGDLLGAGVKLQGGWRLHYSWGYVDRIQSPNSYFALQNPDEVPKFYGRVRMSKAEAVEMARKALRNLDIPLEAVFADQEPRITGPIQDRTNTIPRYRIQWVTPGGGGTESVDIEINADAKRMERLLLHPNANLRRRPPGISVIPPAGRPRPHANPAYAWQLLPIVLRAVDGYAKTLGLPIPTPLTTNHVARFQLADNGGWPHSEVTLTNGWRFIYRNSMLNGFYAPDTLFNVAYGRPTYVRDFLGKTNLGEAQATALVKAQIAKLKYPEHLLHIDFEPQISRPTIKGIPRLRLSWEYTPTNLLTWVEAEVDMDKGVLKSLYFDNKSLWNHPPPINLPISAPLPEATSSSPARRSIRPAPDRPPNRAPSAFNPPIPK